MAEDIPDAADASMKEPAYSVANVELSGRGSDLLFQPGANFDESRNGEPRLPTAVQRSASP